MKSPPHEAGPRRHAGEEREGEPHGGAEAEPARPDEDMVLKAPLHAHDGLAGDVVPGGVVLPVPAGDVAANLVRERGDQRRHHQQRPIVVVAPLEQAAATVGAAACGGRVDVFGAAAAHLLGHLDAVLATVLRRRRE